MTRYGLRSVVLYVLTFCTLGYITLWSALHLTASPQSQENFNSFFRLDQKHVRDATAHSRSHRLVCWLLTQPKSLQTKAKAVKETWAKRCDKHVFFSSVANETFPTVGLEIPEGRENLTPKMLIAFAYTYKMYGDSHDWFLKADDDTYVIIENLRQLLLPYDPKEAIYFGYRFKPYTPQGYASGGAGYVLSREALRRLVMEGVIEQKCKDVTGMEDIDLGRCMYRLGVKLVDTVDHLGRETFHPLPISSYFADVKLPNWTYGYAYHPFKTGDECCSDRTISFHYVRPHEMYIFDFLIYKLKH